MVRRHPRCVLCASARGHSGWSLGTLAHLFPDRCVHPGRRRAGSRPEHRGSAGALAGGAGRGPVGPSGAGAAPLRRKSVPDRARDRTGTERCVHHGPAGTRPAGGGGNRVPLRTRQAQSGVLRAGHARYSGGAPRGGKIRLYPGSGSRRGRMSVRVSERAFEDAIEAALLRHGPGKRFALIVDEAHSSQSGESTRSLKTVLSSGSLAEAEREESGAETHSIARRGGAGPDRHEGSARPFSGRGRDALADHRRAERTFRPGTRSGASRHPRPDDGQARRGGWSR